MIVTIKQLKIIVTTSGSVNGGTDGNVEFHYHKNQWWHVELDHPHDDRQRGRTDSYLIDFAVVESHHPGIGHIPDHVPPFGLNYEEWAGLLAEKRFHIHMKTDDAWEITECYLLGNMALTSTPVRGSAARNLGLGWYLLDRQVFPGGKWLSTDAREGEDRLWFDLTRGAFPTPTFA